MTRSHQIAIAVTHGAAGLLSVIGSGLIFSSVLALSRARLRKMTSFQRLLLGLSGYDLLHSVAVAFSTLPVRKDADVWGAMGTVSTCTAQGFLMQQAQAGFWYNSAISLFFLAVIRYGRKDADIVTTEKWFHAITFLLLEALAVTGLFLDWYNPMWFPELGCWFGPWPVGCEGATCERGEYSFWLAVFGAIIFQVFTFIIVSTCNVLIFLSFRKQERHMARYSGSGDRKFSREIAIQGLLYSGAALNTVFWGFVSLIVGTFDGMSSEGLLFFSLMNAFMFPIQGFFNFLIYLRPLLKKARKNDPESGFLSCFRMALFEDEKTAKLKQGSATLVVSSKAEKSSEEPPPEQRLDDLKEEPSIAGVGDEVPPPTRLEI